MLIEFVNCNTLIFLEVVEVFSVQCFRVIQNHKKNGWAHLLSSLGPWSHILNGKTSQRETQIS